MDIKNTSGGVGHAIIASVLWGILPLYWNLIDHIPSTQILAHRIVWSLIFMSLLLLFNKRLPDLKKTVCNAIDIKFILMASVFITANWGLYIWAVNNNRILETSLGYYILPLISIMFGMLFFKEKLDAYQKISLIFAFVGVIILVAKYGTIPWVSLLLAITFAFYSVLKKMIKIDSIIGLVLETGFIAPIALIYIIANQLSGSGVLGHISITQTLLLLGSGIATAGPLLFHSLATKKISLSTLGFTQYISPSLSLLIGIFVNHEPFTTTHLVSFCFVWCGLVIYSVSQLNSIKKKNSRQTSIYDSSL